MASLLDKKTFRFRIARESMLIFVVILSTYFLSMQLRAHIESINQTIIEENNLYSLRDIHKNTFNLLNEHLRAIRELHLQINNALPPTEDISEFLKTLDTYATKHGVLITTSVGSAAVSDLKLGKIALQTITITIGLNGESGAVRSYISEIEHLPYFFALTSIDERRDTAKPTIQHTVLSGTLWTKPEQTLTQRQQ